MGKRANPMSVKAALTYDIGEAASALGKNPATIRNWIKDGLEVMSCQKPYLLSGAAIREYLRKKYRAAKRPLADEQLYCPSCRDGRKPKNMEVWLSQVSAKTLLLKGVCECCGCTATRMVGQTRLSDFESIFVNAKEPDKET